MFRAKQILRFIFLTCWVSLWITSTFHGVLFAAENHDSAHACQVCIFSNQLARQTLVASHFSFTQELLMERVVTIEPLVSHLNPTHAEYNSRAPPV